MQPSKYMVLSWTNAKCSIVGIYNNQADALAAVAGVSLSGGTLGAGVVPLVGSESMFGIAGVAVS